MRWHLGLAQFAGGHHEEAIANFKSGTDGNTTLSTQMLARALTFAGRPADAIAVWEHAGQGDWDRWLMRAFVLTGRRADVSHV